MRGTRRRLALGTLWAVASLGAACVTAAPPAAADVVLDTFYSVTRPVSWVDGDGHQYLVTSMATGVESENYHALVVGRSRPDGTRDDEWGTVDGRPGLRKIVIDPPGPGAVRESVVAITDDGILTTTWTPAGCSTASGPCDRWYVRTDVLGNVLFPAAMVTDDDRPIRGLQDGSLLTTDPGGTVGWRAPDGSDRGAPPETTGTLGAVAVDRAGRLLMTTGNQRLRRWPAGGPVDLTIETPWCSSSPRVLPAAAPADDGFALVCTPPAGGTSVHRYLAGGTEDWASTSKGDDPEGWLVYPTAVGMDASDRVWAGGSGEVDLYDPPTGAVGEIVVVQSFDRTGAGPVEVARDSQQAGRHEYESWVISEIRALPGGGVAVADHYGCCRSSGEIWPEHTVRGYFLPRLHLRPTCSVQSLAIKGADPTGIDVEFAPCTEELDRRTPTSYVVFRDGPYPMSTSVEVPAGRPRSTPACPRFRA